MAIFPSDTASNIESADDLAKVRQYLRKLNDDLTYMFNNLTPEDNYSASAPKLIYSVDENGEASFEISSSGIKMRVASDEYVKSNVEILDNKISLKVSLGDVVNQVNDELSEISIDPKQIVFNTTGQILIKSGNFRVDASGNAYFKGAIESGSTITGSAFSGGSINIGGTAQAPAFAVDSQGNLTATKGSISIGGTAQAPAFAVDANGNLTANAGSFKGNLDGATIDGENGLHAGGKFYVEYWGSHTHDYDIGCGGFGFYEDENNHDVFSNAPYSEPIRFEVDANTGEVWCSDIYPYTDHRWAMGLAECVDYIWDYLGLGGGGGGGGDDPDPDPDDSELDGPVDP